MQVVESGDRLPYGRCRTSPSAHVREAIEIQVDRPEVVEPIENRADRTWYGIDGPRRRPRAEVSTPPASVVTSPSEDADDAVGAVDAASQRSPDTGQHPTVRDRWREESEERARELAPDRAIAPVPHDAGTAPRDVRDLDERFEIVRVELTLELGRRVDAALARMEGAFEREIEALRTANREEAKRFRSSNGEAFVRIRAADTQELERIRRAIDEGIERLCSVLEGQLDRVWSANDVELERIRSAGADRLAEVHDLLTDQLERLRMERPSESPPPEPAPAPRHSWWRRARSGASG